MRVLKDARDSNEWNWQNWLIFAKNHLYQMDTPAIEALAEAWTWLSNRGLIAVKPAETNFAAFFITRHGQDAMGYGLPWLRAVQRLDVAMLPVLEAKARPLFLRGDFEAAAFMAMKEVEVRVRSMAALPGSLVGTALMQEAFRPPKKDKGEISGPGGPLYKSTSDGGEALATMELFKGAIGLFKNPSSHRRVDYADPTEAAEVVLLADLLMRLLDKLETERAATTT